jgi:hypothetical protein
MCETLKPENGWNLKDLTGERLSISQFFKEEPNQSLLGLGVRIQLCVRERERKN